MSHYSRGRALEHDARAYLRDQGYDVFRTAGSKTAVDLIAIKAGSVLLVQAKTSGILPPAERAELMRLTAILPGSEALLVTRPRTTFHRLTGTGPKDREPWTGDIA